MTRREFGRARMEQQRNHALATAVGSYVVFVSCMAAALGTDNAGGAVLLVVLAFAALMVGLAAASEA